MFEETIFNNYYNKGLFFYQQLTNELEYKRTKAIKGNGQKKLFLGEIFFLNQVVNDVEFQNKDIILLYIGSGPGIHIVKLYNALKTYNNIQWHLYDETKHYDPLLELSMNPRNRITIFKRYFNRNDIKNYLGKKVIFISDIRGVENSEPTVEELIHDYNLQNDIIKGVNPTWISIKWRCPFPDEYSKWLSKNSPLEILNGLECLQIYTKSTSAELRIIAKNDSKIKFREITLEDSIRYEQKMFYYNMMIKTKKFELTNEKIIMDSLNDVIKKNLIP